jgi:hypothetical protein
VADKRVLLSKADVLRLVEHPYIQMGAGGSVFRDMYDGDRSPVLNLLSLLLSTQYVVRIANMVRDTKNRGLAYSYYRVSFVGDLAEGEGGISTTKTGMSFAEDVSTLLEHTYFDVGKIGFRLEETLFRNPWGQGFARGEFLSNVPLADVLVNEEGVEEVRPNALVFTEQGVNKLLGGSYLSLLEKTEYQSLIMKRVELAALNFFGEDNSVLVNELSATKRNYALFLLRTLCLLSIEVL